MAISPDLLKRMILDQREDLRFPRMYIQRSVQKSLGRLSQNKEIIVLSGIRRCGKMAKNIIFSLSQYGSG